MLALPDSGPLGHFPGFPFSQTRLLRPPPLPMTAAANELGSNSAAIACAKSRASSCGWDCRQTASPALAHVLGTHPPPHFPVWKGPCPSPPSQPPPRQRADVGLANTSQQQHPSCRLRHLHRLRCCVAACSLALLVQTHLLLLLLPLRSCSVGVEPREKKADYGPTNDGRKDAAACEQERVQSVTQRGPRQRGEGAGGSVTP